MNIVIVASEMVPYAKTGGLADVVGALPAALHKLGVNVSVIVPYHGRHVRRAKKASAAEPWTAMQRAPKDLVVQLGGNNVTARVFLSEPEPGLRTYLVQNDQYFERPELYGNNNGGYADNHLRFSFFCKAALELIRRYQLHPDVVHCNDWQSALIPVYSHQDYSGYFNTLLTIHNLGYQGQFPKEALPEIGLAWDFYTLDGMEYWGDVNFLKGGLLMASKISTVSPTYATQIGTGAEYGRGLEGVLAARQNDVVGILNGVDYGTWAPGVDRFLDGMRFSPEDLRGKRRCKSRLRERYVLPETPGVPVIGMVSRLDAHKGFDILLDAIDELLEMPVQLALLGSGDGTISKALHEKRRQHPDKFAIALRNDEELAHVTVAGSDMVLMPSRYEPCGLVQLYALRYGTIPVVRATGGLADTVDEGPRGVGFHFEEYSPDALLAALRRGLDKYENRRSWRAMMRRAMRRDHSWDRAAESYVKLYADIITEA